MPKGYQGFQKGNIPPINLIMETDGIYWHAYPKKYSSEDYIYTNNKTGHKYTAQEIWDKDLKRKSNIESLGYKFVRLWENHFDLNLVQSILEKEYVI